MDIQERSPSFIEVKNQKQSSDKKKLKTQKMVKPMPSIQLLQSLKMYSPLEAPSTVKKLNMKSARTTELNLDEFRKSPKVTSRNVRKQLWSVHKDEKDDKLRRSVITKPGKNCMKKSFCNQSSVIPTKRKSSTKSQSKCLSVDDTLPLVNMEQFTVTKIKRTLFSAPHSKPITKRKTTSNQNVNKIPGVSSFVKKIVKPVPSIIITPGERSAKKTVHNNNSSNKKNDKDRKEETINLVFKKLSIIEEKVKTFDEIKSLLNVIVTHLGIDKTTKETKQISPRTINTKYKKEKNTNPLSKTPLHTINEFINTELDEKLNEIPSKINNTPVKIKEISDISEKTNDVSEKTNDISVKTNDITVKINETNEAHFKINESINKTNEHKYETKSKSTSCIMKTPKNNLQKNEEIVIDPIIKANCEKQNKPELIYLNIEPSNINDDNNNNNSKEKHETGEFLPKIGERVRTPLKLIRGTPPRSPLNKTRKSIKSEDSRTPKTQYSTNKTESSIKLKKTWITQFERLENKLLNNSMSSLHCSSPEDSPIIPIQIDKIINSDDDDDVNPLTAKKSKSTSKLLNGNVSQKKTLFKSKDTDFVSESIYVYNELRDEFPKILSTPSNKPNTTMNFLTPSVQGNENKIVSRRVQEQLLRLNDY